MTPQRADPIVREWVDASGTTRAVSTETERAIRAAMGPIEQLPRADAPGGRTGVRCPLPAGYREWGWAVQLYAVRSSESWGIGDLADLRRLASWSRSLGADVLLVSPMGAPNPGPDPEPSPYFPSTRRFRDPLLLHVERVPGVEVAAARVDELGRQGRALNAIRIIDRRQVLRLKLAALEAIWEARAARHPDTRDDVERFAREIGSSLADWGLYNVLAERHGADWRSWPAELRNPAGEAVRAVRASADERIRFHSWIQWQLDEQLAAAAGAGTRLVADLPVGFHPGGFDAWQWQDVLAGGATIGAPPDAFNASGQDWALPPFIPHRLIATDLRPFTETLRAVLRHAGGIRLDHAMGLFRLWWVPDGLGPALGAYVRYPAEDLLAALAAEANRLGALVIGEDLGTVERGVRSSLAAHKILSTRLLYFERRPIPRYPRQALAGVTTHDLPTIAGVWSGADQADIERAGLEPHPHQLARLRRRLARASGIPDNRPVGDVVLAVHRALAESPAALVSATLEDALLVPERPNLPGTTEAQRPNWSVALPVPLEDLERDPFVERLAAALSRRPGGGSGSRAGEA